MEFSRCSNVTSAGSASALIVAPVMGVDEGMARGARGGGRLGGLRLRLRAFGFLS
eukprot:CAMPEP_0197625058 /NCGR_PEP_ID=MMETSP1338-20131121/4526_1 /TAXON_ID=43686 ORGANISM="Pelagodinium beii, Strain RCC1491" /NCGR_SAMPLE_ID=MMETSP1338 /ASSEMBLY_ACC=CAM_ASM_000754 /LENGTH=54 /DNA_ID=CAMNT_0043195367 /DNA_START=434 /DNA_END=595 /DNA_ORIENTATION=+